MRIMKGNKVQYFISPGAALNKVQSRGSVILHLCSMNGVMPHGTCWSQEDLTMQTAGASHGRIEVSCHRSDQQNRRQRM